MQSAVLVRDVPGARMPLARPTIVLVCGGFTDSSSWQGLRAILGDDGFTVRLVRQPTTSLADDVAATRRVIDAVQGPVILVGHSYGGAVITEAGNDPKVAALIYIAAFVPDSGESVSWLINDPTPNGSLPLSLPLAALSGTITDPAWRRKPSWYLVAADDGTIPSRAQWAMAKRARSSITETAGGHALYSTKPTTVAAFIANATSRAVLTTKCA